MDSSRLGGTCISKSNGQGFLCKYRWLSKSRTHSAAASWQVAEHEPCYGVVAAGVMAGDYGTFMPVQVRGKAVPQRFVRDTGIDIPSLGPPLEPVPPRETPPLVPPALRPKTAAKKPAMPASTVSSLGWLRNWRPAALQPLQLDVAPGLI